MQKEKSTLIILKWPCVPLRGWRGRRGLGSLCRDVFGWGGSSLSRAWGDLKGWGCPLEATYAACSPPCCGTGGAGAPHPFLGGSVCPGTLLLWGTTGCLSVRLSSLLSVMPSRGLEAFGSVWSGACPLSPPSPSLPRPHSASSATSAVSALCPACVCGLLTVNNAL